MRAELLDYTSGMAALSVGDTAAAEKFAKSLDARVAPSPSTLPCRCRACVSRKMSSRPSPPFYGCCRTRTPRRAVDGQGKTADADAAFVKATTAETALAIASRHTTFAPSARPAATRCMRAQRYADAKKAYQAALAERPTPASRSTASLRRTSRLATGRGQRRFHRAAHCMAARRARICRKSSPQKPGSVRPWLREPPRPARVESGGRSNLRIVVLGVGVQGTVFAVRLARFGHQVTLVARPERAEELRRQGAVIQDLKTMRTSSQTLPVLTELPPGISADLCLVTVRREQLETALPALAAASGIPRIVFLVNHANGSDDLVKLLGSARTVLAFPGIAGAREDGVVRYLDIPQQRTAVVQASAHDVISLFREAGFPVEPVRDMDAWLQRHAVFISAIAGALYQNGCNAARLGQDSAAVCRLIVAVREGWAAQSRRRCGSCAVCAADDLLLDAALVLCLVLAPAVRLARRRPLFCPARASRAAGDGCAGRGRPHVSSRRRGAGTPAIAGVD